MVKQTTTRDIVAKLWNLCHILRDDGVTYNEYVTEHSTRLSSVAP
jgi:type I restriction enzyme M protein